MTALGGVWCFAVVESETPDQERLSSTTASMDVVIKADLEILYCQYSAELMRFLRCRYGSGPPDPEDVVQAIFEKYAVSARSEPIHNARAFLFRSARNFVIDERRRQSVRREYVTATEAITSHSDDLDAERVLDSQQRWAAIEAAIGDLDARSREMLLMNRIHGLSAAEIARRKGCSATLVKAIIAKALVACSRALDDDG